MAASEGELAVEFVQALTAEARAHREYLQLLYIASLGTVGGGLLLIIGAFAWLTNRALKQAQKSVELVFNEHIESVIQKRSKELSENLSVINQKVEKLGNFEKEAEKIIDELAKLASKSKSVSSDMDSGRVPSDEGYALVIRAESNLWISDIAASYFAYAKGSKTMRVEPAPLEGSPAIIIIDVEAYDPQDISIFERNFFNNPNYNPDLVLVIGNSKLNLRSIFLTLSEFNAELHIVDGAGELVSLLSGKRLRS